MISPMPAGAASTTNIFHRNIGTVTAHSPVSTTVTGLIEDSIGYQVLDQPMSTRTTLKNYTCSAICAAGPPNERSAIFSQSRKSSALPGKDREHTSEVTPASGLIGRVWRHGVHAESKVCLRHI